MADKYFQWNLAIAAAIRIIKNQTDSFCCDQQMLKVVKKLEERMFHKHVLVGNKK